MSDRRPLDPEGLVDAVRGGRDSWRWEPLPPDPLQPPAATSWPELRDALDGMHRGFALPDRPDAGPPGGSLRRRLLRPIGRVTFAVLRRYLHEERDLLARMVQAHESLARRCDELEAQLRELDERVARRQLAEAANLAELAAWLRTPAEPRGAGAEPVTGSDWGDSTSPSSTAPTSDSGPPDRGPEPA